MVPCSLEDLADDPTAAEENDGQAGIRDALILPVRVDGLLRRAQPEGQK
jgi:hypothetical protein